CHFQHPNIGHAEHVRDRFDRSPADPAILILCPHHQRYDSRLLPAGRVQPDLPFRPFGVLSTKFERCRLNRLASQATRNHQRSTAPNAISSEPRIAETSASIWPRHRKSMADKCAKPGARILQRYGLLEPSLTR